MLLAGCQASGGALIVSLKTDYAPATEFAAVRVELFEVLPIDPDTSRPRIEEAPALTSADFIAGHTVAEFAGVAERDIAVRVALLDVSGAEIASRVVLVSMHGQYGLTVLVTRDCRGVSCPAPTDDPTFSACLGGRCVDPHCGPESPEACGVRACSSGADCGAVAECASVECLADVGACLFVPHDDLCRSGERCDVAGGCRSRTCTGGPESCNGDDDDCDGAFDETFDLDTDAGNCGACGRSCAAPYATVACSGGACVIQACDAGRADCDERADTGCETSLASAASCGACTTVCSGATPLCARAAGGGFECVSGCLPPTPDACAGACVDTSTDPAHCGGCGIPCTSGVCLDRVCRMPSCTDDVRNGAETDVDCGGGTCPRCLVGSACAAPSDCTTALCVGSRCAARPLGGECTGDGDCASGTSCADGVCCVPRSGPTDVWTRLAAMPTLRYYPAAVTLNGQIYVLGGIWYVEGAGSGAVAANERYDPTSGAWTILAPMPAARSNVIAASAAGHVHVFSGTDHWDYDPALNAWTIRASLPSAVAAGGAATVGGLVHIYFGTSQLVYDPTIDSYTPGASPPSALGSGIVAEVSGRVYLVNPATRVVLEHDVVADTYTMRSPMPTARSVLTGSWHAVAGGRIHVVGGGASAAGYYEPATDSWGSGANGIAPVRDAAASTALCGRVYLAGGSNPGVAYTLFDAYDIP